VLLPGAGNRADVDRRAGLVLRAAVPVLVAVGLGEPPSILALIGIGAAVMGIVLVSRRAESGEPSEAPERTPGSARAGMTAALGAALAFGLFFVFLDQGGDAGGPPLWVVAGARAGSLPTLTLVGLVGRRPMAWPGRDALVVGLVGIADTTANVLFTYAAASGNLGVVSVLGSLYPVVTVLLARVFLSERLARGQAAGVVVALAGVGLMALR
jgi:drug/metabolite transporter (DMT)-like permease